MIDRRGFLSSFAALRAPPVRSDCTEVEPATRAGAAEAAGQHAL